MSSPVFKLKLSAVSDSPGEGQGARVALSDEELFALCLDGSKEAFKGLVERYELPAVHTARGIVGNTETAREVVQDAFLKGYANREKFDLNRKFSTWFYRILRNQAVDRFRRQLPGTPGAAVQFVGDWDTVESGPVRLASRDERKVAVVRVLSQLPDKFRMILSLRDIEGLSCTVIGERMELAPGTVRWRLHHARKLFRRHWERCYGKETGSGEL